MSNKISKETFHLAYGEPGKPITPSYGIHKASDGTLKLTSSLVSDADGKIMTVSQQLFAIKELVEHEHSATEIKYYKDLANHIFQHKFNQTTPRGYFDRFVSALANWRRGRGFQSTDHMLQKIQAKPIPLEAPKEKQESEIPSKKHLPPPIPSVIVSTKKNPGVDLDEVWSSDPLLKILKGLPVPDLISLAQTSVKFSILASKVAIQRTLNTVKFFNEIFQKEDFPHNKKIALSLTQDDRRDFDPGKPIFKFNEAGWIQTLKDLETAAKSSSAVTNARALIQECHLDLVEALSEYNTVDREIDAKNLLSYIKLPDTAPSYASDVLSLAKKTQKGWGFIESIRSEQTLDSVIGFDRPEHRKERPYFKFLFVRNRQLINQGTPWIHYDWFIGKKQGDRIVFEGEQNQFIIRLDEWSEDQYFERRLVGRCLYQAKLDPFSEKAQKEILKELTDAYSEKVLEEAKQDI